ncbi:MAG: ABC transporter permease [Verrucomicrobia bacterium]|nr:ABC transporter permease [Verrucomicrobiota bacterium]
MNETVGGDKTLFQEDGAPDAIQPNAVAAFRGLLRITLKTQLAARRLPLLLFLICSIPLLVWFTIQDGRSEPFFHWTIDFYLLLLLPLYCLSVCGALIRDDLQADTLGFLTTRPLTRGKLFVMKFICQILLLELLALGSGSLVLAAGLMRSIPDLLAFAPAFLTAQFLGVFAFGALSALLGLFTQRYMVLGIIYGFVVEFGIGRIPTNVNNLAISRHLRTILGNNESIRDMYHWTSEGTLFSVLTVSAAALAFLMIGAVLFTLKEYHHSDDMQK